LSTEPDQTAVAATWRPTSWFAPIVPRYALATPHAAAVVIDNALGAGLAPVENQSREIAPAMWGTGELWEHGDLTVAEEHLATAVSYHVLARLYPRLLGQGSAGSFARKTG
jgi:hypothetical protein